MKRLLTVEEAAEYTGFSVRYLRRLIFERVEGLAVVIREPYGLLVHTLAYGGLRWGEACALRRGRCDLLRSRLEVLESLGEASGGQYFGPTKTYETRTVVVPGFLRDLLAEHLVGTVAKDRQALVFTAAAGPRCGTRTSTAGSGGRPWQGAGSEPGEALRRDHDGRPEGPEALEEVGGVGGGLQGGELVNDEQHCLACGLAGRGVVGEVLQEEAPQAGGLLLEGQALKEEVGGVDVVEGEGAVEAVGDGSEEGPVTVGHAGDIALDELVDLGGVGPASRRAGLRRRESSSPEDRGGPGGPDAARSRTLRAISR